MSGKVEGRQCNSSDKSAEFFSPWQLAKRIAAEATGPAASHRALAVDDTVVDYRLLIDE